MSLSFVIFCRIKIKLSELQEFLPTMGVLVIF